MSEEIKKRCTKCGISKTLDQFYRHALGKYGREAECKDCRNARNKAWVKTHPEDVGRIRRKHQHTEKAHNYQKTWRRANKERNRDYAKKSYYKHREASRARSKRFFEKNPDYRKRWAEGNKNKVRAALKRWASRNYEKTLAHIAVRNAVKTGKLPRVKTLKCSQCGQPAVNYHHHKGYSKEYWLDVIPVCYKCHKKLDSATS